MKKKIAKTGFYIDTNIFVGYARKKEDNHKASKEAIDYIKKNMTDKRFNRKFDFFTSRFTEAEIASALKRRKESENKIRAFLHKMNSPSWAKAVIPLPEEDMAIKQFVPLVVETAIKLGAKFADNVQACCVNLYKDSIDYVVTEDRNFKNKLIKKMKRIKIVDTQTMLILLKKLRTEESLK